MSLANGDVGLTFETHACERIDAEHVATDGGPHKAVDAVSTRAVRAMSLDTAIHTKLYYADGIRGGDRIACKVASYRIKDGDTTRRGRYWIPRGELERVDAYALGVHDDAAIIEDAFTILPAAEIEALIGSWVDSPRDDTEQVTRLSWARVFDPAEVHVEVADGE